MQIWLVDLGVTSGVTVLKCGSQGFNSCVYWLFYVGCKYGCQFGREVRCYRLSILVWGYGVHELGVFMKLDFFKLRCRETGLR